MNLLLHGVEPHIYLGDAIYEPDRGERYDVVLTNPPFGTKGANQAPDRDDSFRYGPIATLFRNVLSPSRGFGPVRISIPTVETVGYFRASLRD